MPAGDDDGPDGGMAVAQAQHRLREIYDLLSKKDIVKALAQESRA